MFKHILSKDSKSSITKGKITEDQIQPNAIDIRVDKIFELKSTNFVLTENDKTHRQIKEVEPYQEHSNRSEIFILPPGIYDFQSDVDIEIGEGEAGWLIARSTLVRNGLTIVSGLYDSGFKGTIGGVLHVQGGFAHITRGARIAQFVLSEAESIGVYEGSYGTGKEDEERY